jgi:hypothetical protein
LIAALIGAILLAMLASAVYSSVQVVRTTRFRRRFTRAIEGQPPEFARLEYAAVDSDEITVYLQQHTLTQYPTASVIAELPRAHARLYMDRLRFRQATIQAAQVTLTALGPLVFSLAMVPVWRLAGTLYTSSVGATNASSGLPNAAASLTLGLLTVVMAALLAMPGLAAVIGRAKTVETKRLLSAYRRVLEH